MTTADLVIYAADVLGGTEDPIRQGERVPDVAIGLVNAFGAASFDEDLAEYPGYESPMELVCAALEAWADSRAALLLRIHDYKTGAFIRKATPAELSKYVELGGLGQDTTGVVWGDDIAADLDGHAVYFTE
jgi:hypothetical protein